VTRPLDFKRWLHSRRLAVLLGGTSAERSISLKTGQAILKSLKRQGFDAVALDAGPSLPSDLLKKKINYVFLALHGTGGEDGTVQGLLDWMKIPYTGSGVLASALAMDKIATKRIFEAAHLRTAPWFSLTAAQRRGSLSLARRLGFPLVVKPASQGSAIGISIVRHASEWETALTNGFKYGPVMLVERYLSGPEITVGVLGHLVLPIIEIVPTKGPFYDFNAKYAPGGSRHILPARIAPSVAKKAGVLSRLACEVLGTRGAARVDLIVDKDLGAVLLEVNTIPGMTETSLLPEAAKAAGLSFDDLVYQIAESSYGPA
jgi:D-alanine-D-alanine ligase